MSQIDQTRERTEGEPKGIGGWLILPLVGLCLAPVYGLWMLWQALPVFGVVGQLQPAQRGLLVIETAINFMLQVVAPVFLLTQLFQTKAQFPRLFQLLLAANLGWMLVDLALGFVLFREVYASGAAQLFDRDTIRTMTQSVVGAAIWIPYMSVSVRVRNTFIN